MGVSTNIYVVHGVRIPWDDGLAEELDRAGTDPEAPWTVVDGMGGDYMVMGTLLFDSGDHRRWGWEGGDWQREIDPGDLPGLESAYRLAWQRCHPTLLHAIDRPFRIIAFMHHS